MIILRVIVFLAGLALIIWTAISIARAFVLPRGENSLLLRLVSRYLLTFFRIRLRSATTYKERDQVMALFAPLVLLLVPVFCLIFVLIGYTAMFWATGVTPLSDAYILSGSSLFTLGFATDSSLLRTTMMFSEAAFGLGVVALLIAYLPAIYSSFAARERLVAMLEVRAGNPPSAVELLKRYHRIGRLAQLPALFADWEVWFTDIEESHTTYTTLTFFRSPQPERSWITAAGVILDAASLYLACIDDDLRERQVAALCIRAGYISLSRIATLFNIPHEKNATPETPIAIARSEFEAAYYEMAEAGCPLLTDIDQAWRDFKGWRANYDQVLIALATVTMAPYAPWSSDRSLASKQMRLMSRRIPLFRRKR